MEIDPRLWACLPRRLHPVSRMFLESWLQGRISTEIFRRYFHMPNSTYLSVSECLIATANRINRARRV